MAPRGQGPALFLPQMPFLGSRCPASRAGSEPLAGGSGGEKDAQPIESHYNQSPLANHLEWNLSPLAGRCHGQSRLHLTPFEMLPRACARNNPLLWFSVVPVPGAAAAISKSYVSRWGIPRLGLSTIFFSSSTLNSFFST
jgi:hypothetical protein